MFRLVRQPTVLSSQNNYVLIEHFFATPDPRAEIMYTPYCPTFIDVWALAV